MDKYLIEKRAVIVWKAYLKICKQGFVLDEEADWLLLEKALKEIKELDPEAEVYACTYPIEKTDDGMYMYCDNLWIKTELKENQIAGIFSQYRQIEPCCIDRLAEDERNSVDIYMMDETHYCDFADVMNEYETPNTISIYWD